MDFDELARTLRTFAEDRDWEQYHDPKNLSMALAAEAGELLEVFQWKTSSEVRRGVDEADIAAASEELADVLIFLIRLADVLDVDLDDAVEKKLVLNAERYPIDLAKGNATKHNRRKP